MRNIKLSYLNGMNLNQAIGSLAGKQGRKAVLEAAAYLQENLPVDSISYEGFGGYKTINVPCEREDKDEVFIRKTLDSRVVHTKFIDALEVQEDCIEGINSLLKGDYYHLRNEDIEEAFLWEAIYDMATTFSLKKTKDGKPDEKYILAKDVVKDAIQNKLNEGKSLAELKIAVYNDYHKLLGTKVDDLLNSLYYKKERIMKAIEQDLKFYFTYFGDSCMRIYTKETDFSYQSSSMFKSLIYSCYEEPFTKAGRKQLESSIANAFGLEKSSRDERTKWFNDNRGNLGNLKHQAKDYWKYTTLVREYEAMLQHQVNRSGILVGFDASASGCSILSLLTKDRKTAELTNTIKSDGCKDYYMEAYHLFQANAKKKKIDLPNLSRERIKKAIMTYWYNSYKNPDSMLKELAKDDREKYKILTKVWEETLSELSPNLNKFKEEFNRIFEDYLLRDFSVKPLMGLVNPDVKNIKWRTPDGVLNMVEFEVKESMDIAFERKYTNKYNGKIGIEKLSIKNFQYSENRNTIDNAWRSVLPRFVHSIDAYIMRNVVKKFKEALPKAAILCNHDCFYIHPNHYGVLMNCYKEQLVEVAKPEFLRYMLFSILEEFNNSDYGVKLDIDPKGFYVSGTKKGMNFNKLLEWKESFNEEDILGGEYTLY